MKCQILFSGKNIKKNIFNLSSAELAQRVVNLVKVLMFFLLLYEDICCGYSLDCEMFLMSTHNISSSILEHLAP